MMMDWERGRWGGGQGAMFVTLVDITSWADPTACLLTGDVALSGAQA
jgi:hypothetical protein